MKSAGELDRVPERAFRTSSQLNIEELERRMMMHLEQNGFITRSIYTNLTGRLKWKATEDLKIFVEKGVIRKMGRGNQMYYVKVEGSCTNNLP